jgi:hypothetical protein
MKDTCRQQTEFPNLQFPIRLKIGKTIYLFLPIENLPPSIPRVGSGATSRQKRVLLKGMATVK